MNKVKLMLILVVFAAASIAVNGQSDLGTVDPAVQLQIGKALTPYYAVKDALVASDAEAASSKAGELGKVLEMIDQAKMTVDQKAFWAKLSAPLKKDARHISTKKDLEHQREHFMTLSGNMYSLVVGFKANETDAFLQYCPMKKASWLSAVKEIENPYYGSRMLTCGSVKATIKKAKP